MRLSAYMIAFVAIFAAAGLSLVSAFLAAGAIETRAETAIRSILSKEGITWAQVETDGLRAQISGTAPNEAMRFRALSLTGTVVDASRVIDRMTVTPASPVTPPDYSVELLRNAQGISMIGLIPSGDDRDQLVKAVARIAGTAEVTDMLDSASYPRPAQWQAALAFSIDALALLPRSKISAQADRVVVNAVSGSPEEKAELEAKLRRMSPDDVRVVLNITSPRPVIAPFTLRFVMDGEGARFDACTAHTAIGRALILQSAFEAGMKGNAECIIGLGVPSPAWPQAVQSGIAALQQVGGGTLTMSDADVTLVATPGTAEPLFDRVKGELEAELPEIFTLHAILPEPSAEDDARIAGPVEFSATRGADGKVALRGRVHDALEREAVAGYAQALFGQNNVQATMITDNALPRGWSVRVLAGLQSLADLSEGNVTVRPDFVTLQGKTERVGARADIARLYGEKLGEAQDFRIDVVFVQPPEPETVASEDPAACLGRLNGTQDDAKIAFAPGSSNFEPGSLQIIDAIADILRECPDVAVEIGGHTDSQGREAMNAQLSQQRAEAVLMALVSRRILTRNLTAHGYGESTPVADNDTEEGREANRRIEFRLVAAPEDTAEQATTSAEEEAEDEQN